MHTHPPFHTPQGQIAVGRLELSSPVCLEVFKDHPQMGRFTLRDEGNPMPINKNQSSPHHRAGKTVGIGKVLKLRDGEESSSAPAPTQAQAATPATTTTTTTTQPDAETADAPAEE